MGQKHTEPSLRPKASRSEERLTDLFERAESALISVVALFLIAFVVVALIAVVMDVRGPLFHDHDFTVAAQRGIDATFLAIILLELLHTTLSRGPISQQLQEFLVIGITASVRHGLAVAAVGGSGARDVVINLAINAVGALILVAALWLVRQQLRADRRAEGEGQEAEMDASDEEEGTGGSADTGYRDDRQRHTVA